jgi:superfamily I DNA/RNA helicase/RecB family exonuclease
MPGVELRLVRTRGSGEPPPALDADQAAAVAHRQGSGPLVVLGAPGTGTTTVLVEAVLARVERDGVRPDAVLVLAPTRAAAAALRDRVSARLRRTVREPLARTPHSYAFGLLRRARVLDGDAPPRLIAGPEQDRVLADLLAGHDAGHGHSPGWPPGIGPGVRALRGFRDELRDLLMRAVERDLSPADLAALGRRHDRPEWVAAAGVLAEYLDVTSLATPGAFDPAGIVDAAAALLEDDPDLLAAEREQWSVIGVDDAQETTAATARLLGLLADGGRDLILAGDPDVATQAFRGGRPRLLAEAAEAFPRADGDPARRVVLRTVHRHGPVLRAVSERIAVRIGSSGVVAQRAARAAAVPDGSPTGSLDVRVLATAAQEASYVAARLRREHLTGGIPWDRMAVIARSSRSTDAIRRALAAAGVPVAVPPAEIPVRDEPAVVPLRLALRASLEPEAITPEIAVELLCGPIGGADSLALRRLRQALRASELAGGGGRGSDALLVEALATPTVVTIEVAVAAPAVRVATVLQAGRAAAASPSATAETVLWALWEASGLAEPWRRTALRGGAAGARADRDLDAVVALFEAAARYVDRLPRAGPGAFLDYLEGQDLPADTLAERAPAGQAVALVTPHGAAGREWDVVAVTGLQEGTWPDLRLRSSLLGAQALADLLDGRSDPSSTSASAARRSVLDDELRLFHVAASRARRRLLLTAVRSDEEIPSPFLDIADPDGAQAEIRPLASVPRTMTLPALVARLRAVVTDASAGAGTRSVAAGQLARLAAAGVPGADPADWYGLAAASVGGPLREPGAPVRVSPSKVESFDRCALRWLLQKVGGTAGSSRAQGLGTLIHEIAAAEPDADPQRLRQLLAERISSLGLGSGWIADAERARAETMIVKLAEYVQAARREGRELVAAEQGVHVELGTAVVRGQVDRLERDAEGRLVVVDLKTGKSAPTRAEAARNAQLGVYQLTVEAGGFADVADGARASGGAVLVQLGTSAVKPSVQRQPALDADDDPDWARRLVQRVAEGMAGEVFPATTNPMCTPCEVRRSCPVQVEGRQVGQ